MMRRFAFVCSRTAGKGRLPWLGLARPFGTAGDKKSYSKEKREKFAAILPQAETTATGSQVEESGALNLEQEANFSANEVGTADPSGLLWRARV